MRAPISVVIPTLNAASGLPGCLAALMEGVEAGLIRDLTVTDGGSTDATAQIAGEVGAQWVTGAPGRGGQLARGVAATQGDWLLVIHADTQLAPGWSEEVAAALATPAAWHFRLRFDARGVMPAWVAGWANWRAHRLGLPYGDQGLLVPRGLYDRVGGYRDIPLMEDVALARALSGHHRQLAARAVTSADRYRRDGWLRRGGRNLWLLARYFMGVDPARLVRSYGASPD